MFISGINFIFSLLGEYLDQYLKPLVKQGKSYLRDSMQLILDLKSITGIHNCLLVTIDVNSLYTSIVQKDRLKGIERALHKYTGIKQEQIEFIHEGLQLAMEGNYFWYNKNYYVQTKGVAMGADYAPSFANLFMNMWEEEHVYEKRIHQIKLYHQYIDDLIISGSLEN